jgi:putative heme-binding domain-containing protein
MAGAVLASAARHSEALLRDVLVRAPDSRGRSQMIEKLIATAIGVEGAQGNQSPAVVIDRILGFILPSTGTIESWQPAALAGLLDALDRRGQTLASFFADSNSPVQRHRAGLVRLLEHARRVVLNEALQPGDRASAARLLGRSAETLETATAPQSPNDFELLASFLSVKTPPVLRSAAIATLARTRDPRAPTLLLAPWTSYSPAVRGEILDVLLARKEWIEIALAAMESGGVRPFDLDASRRDRLLRHYSPEIRERAAKLFAGAVSGDRQKIIDDYRPALAKAGNVIRGSDVFARACASCHRFRGRGVELGPNLASLKEKSPDVLLTAILDPNRAVEGRYMNYLATTTDGRVLSGLVLSETSNSITLVRADGGKDTILRVDLDEFKSTNKSFMPEGLEKDLKPADAADLIAFLQSDARPAGEGTLAQPSASRALKESGASSVRVLQSQPSNRAVATWLGDCRIDRPVAREQGARLAWEASSKAAAGAGRTLFRFPIALETGPTLADEPLSLELNGRTIGALPSNFADGATAGADGRVKFAFLAMQASHERKSGVLDIEVPEEWAPSGKPARFALTGPPQAIPRIGLIQLGD